MKTALSPKEVALAVAVSESSVKRWVDDGVIVAAKTSGGHRRIALTEVIRFARQSGIPVVRPDILGLGDLDALQLETMARQAPQQVLQDALLAGRAVEARGVVLSQYVAGRSVAEIWDQILAPLLRYLGTLWQRAPSGIYVEHRATDICTQAISQLRFVVPPTPTGAPLAIGGGPSGDPYTLPTWMAATVVAAAGFREINLGAETPLDILAQAARQFDAKIVWLAVTAAKPVETLLVQTQRLARQLGEHGSHLVVGGRGLPRGFAMREPNVHMAATMTELEAFAKGIMAARPDGGGGPA